MKVLASVSPEIFMKRALYLAWKACGGPLGMGFLQDKPEATEEDVWNNVCTQGDYAGNFRNKNEFYGDYVFGRMMKWGGKKDGDMLIISDQTFDGAYQGFSRKYKDTKTLLDATAESLGCEYEVQP